jgi:hypothetical protein
MLYVHNKCANAQIKLAFTNVCSIIATKAREKEKSDNFVNENTHPPPQKKILHSQGKGHNFLPTSGSDGQLQRKQMLLPDMFDSSGGPPGKYCHTGTGPSAHTYHSPSALKVKKSRQ